MPLNRVRSSAVLSHASGTPAAISMRSPQACKKRQPEHFRSPAVVLMLCLTLGLGGCGDYWTSTVLRKRNLGEGQTLATTADLRLVTTTRPVYSQHGLVTPRQIICAEPSPDVAKAVSAALDATLSANVAVKAANAPAEGNGSMASALSKSRAEALAQMTRRLATIQLLRDGLYRACEAYANGAISDTTYAVLLSRYDKAMITMLLGELAAGNFGDSLATLGGTAKGTAVATTPDALQKLQDANADVVAKQKADDAAKAAATAAPDDADKQAALKTADADLKAAQDAQSAALKVVSAAASSDVSAAVNAAVGSIAHTVDGSAKDALLTMQRKYIENLNFDPIIVACITALDRPESDSRSSSKLAELCDVELTKALKVTGEVYEDVVGPEKEAEKDNRSLMKAVSRITDTRTELKPLDPPPEAKAKAASKEKPK